MSAGTLIDLLRFAVVLGVLVFVHELGHFILARRSGVLVQRFSLGFGPRLFGIVRKGTDYCVSLVPLGGYVKMAGQEDFPESKGEGEEEEEKEEKIPDHLKYSSKTVGQRLSIVVAGPVMNIILGAVLFSAIFMIGRGVALFLQEGIVGAVTPGSPAAQAGVRPGDRVISVNGRKISDWEQITKITGTHAGQPLRFEFKRDGKLIYMELVPVEMEGVRRAVVGLTPGGAAKVVSVIEGGPASKAGLRAGEIVEGIDGKAVFYPSIREIIGDSAGKGLTLSVLDEDGRKRKIEITPEEIGVIEGVLLEKGTVLVTGVEEKTGNFRPGDRIAAVNGKELSGESVDREVARNPNRNLRLTVIRKGRFFQHESRFEVGVRTGSKGEIRAVFTVDTEMQVERFPWYLAIPRGVVETGSAVKMLYQILISMLTGRLSWGNVGGPIVIYILSSKTAAFGLVSFLYFVAMISVNLGVINLIPFPVLDGGHVLFLLIEKVRRKPLGDKQMEIIQQVGLALIFLLIALVFYNDIVNWVLP